MALQKSAAEFFKGFSKLNREQRFTRLVQMGALSSEDVAALSAQQTLDTDLAEKFIENVVGYYQLPLGVATNFRIDDKDYVIPMAVEETSIIAALCKTAKWIRECGEITTEVNGNTIIGQIQLAKISDYTRFTEIIQQHSAKLMQSANSGAAKSLFQRGGGVTRLEVREITREDGHTMAVIHLHANPCDAMGANMMIQICEQLKDPVQALTGETVTMCILSNLNDSRLTTARVVIRDIDPDIGDKLQEASVFAHEDPYRAATNNKGVMNGVDPLLIATGNDWRAVEAGMHAYATRSGQYRSLTKWSMQGNDLHGELTAPIDVGIVGGMTRLHPTAQMSLRMLGIDSARELSRLCAAVGLVQNLGALRALISLGFTQGHMKLHIDNLTMSAGANADEVPLLRERLEEMLRTTRRITQTNARECLQEIRRQSSQAWS